MKRGRTLFLIDYDETTRVKLQKWRVSSVQRPPRRRFRFGANTREKRVYLRMGEGRETWERASFDLSKWPSKTAFAASAKAAWNKAVTRISSDIRSYEEILTEWTTEEDGEGIQEAKAALRILRGNLTIAKKRGS